MSGKGANVLHPPDRHGQRVAGERRCWSAGIIDEQGQRAGGRSAGGVLRETTVVHVTDDSQMCFFSLVPSYSPGGSSVAAPLV